MGAWLLGLCLRRPWQLDIDGRDVNWTVNSEGVLVVVLPFMVNRNGLIRNASIQKVGEFIRKHACAAP